ncbi:hypothetical protein HYH02_002890 [Chlamydomonas schloesseri]|uniref:ACB domain-containing protein n=1 Tax=Chlamydomonas schloesseri TaxID=2026947 RepID=A0A835WSJ2_9CHLO|nr:hypothetical protein HYH02_002890 [Chlamydomonas schloesseri]|eukprot:KAG2452657.1 hypothetical protein HYH02_002890 [Chlamydomonas schloesseri]
MAASIAPAPTPAGAGPGTNAAAASSNIDTSGNAAATTTATATTTSSSSRPRRDPDSAVALLHAAGDDVEALAEAIAEAGFLDATPGDHRQKLRAARTRLRNLNAAAARADKADRSPHAKSEYSAADFEALTGQYEKLNWRMVSKPGGATVKPDDFYRLYGLHMQASRGDNTGERPMWAERGGLDFEGRARWDAWTALRGTDGAKARLRFVKLFHEFAPAALYRDTRAAVLAVLAPPAETVAGAAGEAKLAADAPAGPAAAE